VRRLVAVAVVCAAAAVAPAAGAAPGLLTGIYEEAETLFAGDPSEGVATLGELGAGVLRLNLYWNRVAPTQPLDETDPADPAYDWSLYDRVVLLAKQRGIRILFSIVFTPPWANGGQDVRFAPRDSWDLQEFARAAARRYSGRFTPPAPPAERRLTGAGSVLPRVDLWMAWNEPNNPNFLKPQGERAGSRFRPASPRIYARLCNAVVDGIHAGERIMRVSRGTVACGAMAPRGNNVFGGSRPSISPLLFLREMKKAGADPDVLAHHAYALSRLESPSTKPGSKNAITLGNIDVLLAEMGKLYPGKRLWITEYGYQTNPPDPLFGVSWARQAEWLREAYALARAKPKIAMLLWFLVKDEREVGRWQSGLVSAAGQRKPSFDAFREIAR